jgi:hypothetical protein
LQSSPGCLYKNHIFAKLVGPAAEEIRLWFKKQLRILGKAQAILQNVGRNPNAVPFHTLLSILEAGTIEDDESLHQMGCFRGTG